MESPWKSGNHLLIPRQKREQLCMKPNTGFLVVLKEGHCGKITVYLDRIHRYLCAVKFYKDACSIKEAAHDPAHDHKC